MNSNTEAPFQEPVSLNSLTLIEEQVANLQTASSSQKSTTTIAEHFTPKNIKNSNLLDPTANNSTNDSEPVQRRLRKSSSMSESLLNFDHVYDAINKFFDKENLDIVCPLGLVPRQKKETILKPSPKLEK